MVPCISTEIRDRVLEQKGVKTKMATYTQRWENAADWTRTTATKALCHGTKQKTTTSASLITDCTWATWRSAFLSASVHDCKALTEEYASNCLCAPATWSLLWITSRVLTHATRSSGTRGKMRHTVAHLVRASLRTALTAFVRSAVRPEVSRFLGVLHARIRNIYSNLGNDCQHFQVSPF